MRVHRGSLFVACVLALLARGAGAYVCSAGGSGALTIQHLGVATASSNPATAGNATDGNVYTSWVAAPGTTSAVFTWEAPVDVVVGQVKLPSTLPPPYPPFTYGEVFVELLDASDSVLASGNAKLVSNASGTTGWRVFDAGNRWLRKIRLTVASSFGTPSYLSLNEIDISYALPALPPAWPPPGPEELTSVSTFRGVGDGAGGAFLSRANGVSPNGRVVVGETETAPGKLSGFRFQGGTLTPLGSGTSLLTTLTSPPNLACLTADESRAFAASNSGLIVGNTCKGGVCGVTRFGGGAPEVYDPPLPPFYIFSVGNYASDITPNGVTIAGMYQTSGPTWSGESLIRLNVPTYAHVASFGLGGQIITHPRMSPNGQCLVATVYPGGGFPIETDSYGNCGVLPTETATDVSAGGIHIVGSTGGIAARGSELLGDLEGGALASRALGVADDGDTVVGWGTTDAGQEAFVWTPEDGIERLADVLTSQGINLSGWTLREATGVSATGRTIVGWGTNPSGQTEGFIATLPAPAAPTPVDAPALREPGLALLAAALALTAALRLRRRA